MHPVLKHVQDSPVCILPIVLGVLKVLERQKAWQQRWRERHEREGTLYDAVAVVEDVIIGRWVSDQCIDAVSMPSAGDCTKVGGLVILPYI